MSDLCGFLRIRRVQVQCALHVCSVAAKLILLHSVEFGRGGGKAVSFGGEKRQRPALPDRFHEKEAAPRAGYSCIYVAPWRGHYGRVLAPWWYQKQEDFWAGFGTMAGPKVVRLRRRRRRWLVPTGPALPISLLRRLDGSRRF